MDIRPGYGLNGPKVALIGRPNVGKSTLFNKLTRSKDALVAEMPGLTRDRRYAQAQLPGGPVVLIDTGGVASDLEDPLAKSVIDQTRQAIDEADLLLLIFDARHGLVPDDLLLVNMARQSNKPFLAIANKVDSPDKELLTADFFEAGLQELLNVSAKTGRGVQQLRERLSELLEPFWPDKPLDSSEDIKEGEMDDENGPIRISLIGRPNVGKSSILNRLIGQPRMVVSDIPGTTRDAIDCLVTRDDGPPLIFVDTAGVRRRSRVKDKVEKFSVIKSIDAIKDSHICICIFDVQEGITDQDKRLVGYTAQYGKACITLFNKWDLVKEDPKIRRLLNEQAKFLRKVVPYAPHLNVSALTGKNINKLIPLIDQVFQHYSYKETTGKLNRLLKQAMMRRNPPVTKGHYLKLYYVTQTGIRPPTFTFFANYPELFPDHYRRYLANFFRDELGLHSSPTRIVLRSR